MLGMLVGEVDMTPLTQQLEDKKKGCIKLIETFNTPDGDLGERYCGDVFLGEVRYCRECQAEIAILEQAIAEMQKQRQDFAEKLKERIMRNGNLSGRIVENKDGEFEHKHDYVLNKIVCLIIDDELQQQLTNQSQQELNETNLKVHNEETQEIKHLVNDCRCTADISNLLQKQRQEILEKIDKLDFYDNSEHPTSCNMCGFSMVKLKQQLNQPKTEKENSK